ncbi:MAG: nucleotidyltransferase family protein [Armatimonadota bacterium]|nr:nucleotidyltransferase family protein [bacterium]MDW8320720.1 nucleotidyltransferase family protein [Armatimonadota bacterium]
MSFSAVTAIVLAGGQSKPDLLAITGAPNRALLQVDGETLLARVVRALRESGAVGRIIAVGNLAPVEGCIVLPDTGDFVENVLQAAALVEEDGYILYATADTPFLTPQAVADFVSRASLSQADMYYPIIPLELCQRRFPNMPRTALSLREGTFTGGNLLLIRADVVRRQEHLLRRAFAARKSIWGMAKILGAGIIVRAVLSMLLSPRLLSIAHIKHRVQRLMNATAQEIITEYAEIGVDIDRAEHVQKLREAGYRVGNA